MRIYEAFFLLSFLCFVSRKSFAQETKILRLCISQSSCESCLEASSACAWCSAWSYSNATLGKPRCNSPHRLRAFGCPEPEIRTAPPESVEFPENLDFQDVVTGQAPVQLRPQRIKLRLRPHSKREIRLQYRPAKNYPLDLYYLMDLTWSMKDDKETLVGLGWKMSTTFGTFTQNFRLGFGSYADKPLMPYLFPGHEENPCKSEHATCAPLYSFQHHLELTEDINRFVHEVNYSSVTGNVDNLEGGLDGIVQAIVCTKEIGWAHQARKLMLVATDGFLHFAGEGKLGGVVDRHDFQCHLDARGQYSESTRYDYPSLAEISKLLQERKVNLIFAVTEDKRREYEMIADLLKEKATVGTLTGNSSNILEIIESAYHRIVTKVVLQDNSTNPLHLEYFSNCGQKDEPESSTSECEGIEEGHVYDFKVVFSVDKCPRNESLWKQTVIIDDALASEASEILVEVEILCGCDCKDVESFHCVHGSNECGLCKCDFGWSGELCDCDESSPLENRLQCIAEDSAEICSGKGDCVCGQCICDEGYKGQFCECSPCDKNEGIECSGKGTCNCGVCECLDGWEGPGCQCPSGDTYCIAPGSQDVCANHGYCDCGKCMCNTTAIDGLFYRGTYCESSASAGGSALCVLYNPCVVAVVEDSDEKEELCRTNITVYQTERVDTVNAEDEQFCLVRSRDDRPCKVPYVYKFQKNGTVTLYVGPKACVRHAAIVPSIISAAVLLTGIISLLIWKCWTHIQDKREYAKFEQERKRTVYALDENPLFRPATTRFRVPSMYKDD